MYTEKQHWFPFPRQQHPRSFSGSLDLGRGKLDYAKSLQTYLFQAFAEGPFYNFTILPNELILLIPYLGINPKEIFLN